MRRCRPLLGTFVEIDADDLGAIETGFAAIARVHALMSAHDPLSELSRINRFGHVRAVPVCAETRDVLLRASHLAERSGGLFDVVRAGSRAIADGRLPLHSDQPRPLAAHWSTLSLGEDGARLNAPACLDLGGIAKGFAVDQAVAAMRSAGAARGLVNAGGDMFAFGPEAWPVTVADPQTREPRVEISLREAAVATSALLPDGSNDHLPAAGWRSLTVHAANACDADALTKVAWTDPARAAVIFDRFGASAFGITLDGAVAPIVARRIAA